MENLKKGSYKLEAMAKPQDELDRLKRQGEIFRELECKTLRECGLHSNDRVLELGCGPGFVTKILADLVKGGELVSVDNDPELLKQIDLKTLAQPQGGFRIIEASADNLPIDDHWADFTYARFLLQHVTSPQAIVDEGFRCTRPGGLFCAVDSDDGLILHHPVDQEIDAFLNRAEKKQAEYGGDRFVGRKMFSLLQNAGFVNIKVTVLSLNTSEIPPSVLFGLLFGYKSTLQTDSDYASSLLAGLTKRAEEGELFLSAGVFIVVGQKPE